MVSALGVLGGGAVVTVVIQAVDKLTPALKGINANMLAFGTAMATIGVAGGIMLTGLAKDASNLGESVNAVSVVFGDAASEILKIGESASESFGLSKQAFNEGAVRFSAFAEVIAGEGGNVATVITDMTGRTADFASVMNIDLARAQTLMQAGLAGETEGLRRFGIDVAAATIKTFAYANGIAEAGTELTEQEKILARYGTIMEQTNKFAGDFVNTSDDFANSQRILQADIENVRAELGEALLPILTSVTAAARDVVKWFTDLSPVTKKIIVGVAALAAGLLVLGGAILIVTAVSGALAVVWSPITLIVLGIIAAIALLVFAGKKLMKHWGVIIAAVKNVGVIFANVFIGIHNVVIGIWNGIVNFIGNSINRIIDMVNSLISKLNRIPGINISMIGNVSFEKFKGEMMDFKSFVPTDSDADKGSGGTTININGPINGMTGADIATSLQNELTKKVSLS